MPADEMPPTNLILEALHAIHGEIRNTNAGLAETNARLDQTNARLDQTNSRLDQTNARLGQTNLRLEQSIERLGRLENRVTEGFIETNTKLAELAGRVDHMQEHLSARIDQVGARIENLLTGQLGQDVRDLKDWAHQVDVRLASPSAHERESAYPKKE